MNQSRVTRYVAYPVTAILMVALATVVLFAACFVYETEKKVAFWAAAAIVAICATPQFRRRLRERCSIFFLLVTAYILLAGASTFYAYAPKFALSEFSRLLAAYAVFLAVFSFAKKETLPNAAAVLSGAISLLSLLHLDAASGGLFAHKIMLKFQMWTGGGYTIDQYGQYTYGYNSAAGRLYGMFGNSNTMATMCAIGIFLALYLLLRAKGFHRLLPCAALVINAVTFLMCISLGATASLGMTVLLVLLFLHGAYNRLSFLLVTLETLLVSGSVAALSFPHMGNKVPSGYLVLVFCVIGCLVLFAMDWLLRPRLVNVLCKRVKILCAGLAVLIVLIIGAAAVMVLQTDSVTIQGSKTYATRFFPGTGTCSITLDMDGEARVLVQSTTKAQILTATASNLSNEVYEGTVTVEVPEDSVEIQLKVTPLNDGTVTIHGVSYTGSEGSKSLPAGYRWIPYEMVQRLQGLSTNHSALRRLFYLEDGMKMWMQTPLLGRGLGGFENGLASVQDFFYETKYAHNYYVQILCDLGIVGLLLFLSVLGFAIKNLWALRRQEEQGHTLFPALLGAVLMFTIHGGFEISASVAEVSIFAFGTFGIITHISPMPALLKKYEKRIIWSGTAVLGLLAAVFGFLLFQNFRAAEIVNQETVTTAQLKKCVELDVFEGDDYRLTYVVAAMSIQDEEVYQQADIYADELQRGNSNAVGSYLTEYYLHRGYFAKAAEASEKFLTYTRSNAESWNTQFHIFEAALLGTGDVERMDAIAQLAMDTYERLLMVNQEQMDDLPLDAQSASFVTRLLAKEGTLSERMGTLLLDSQFAPDTNGDGCPDAVKVKSGTVQWEENGGVTATEDSVVLFQVVPNYAGRYMLTIETATPDQIAVVIGNYALDQTLVSDSMEIGFEISEDMLYQPLSIQVTIPSGIGIQRMIGTVSLSA